MKKKIKVTREQYNIIECFRDNVPNIKVNAYAGTGKTFTLERIVKSSRNKNILYLAFNRSVIEEAKRRFGDCCSIKTIHSLAYAATSIYRKPTKLIYLNPYDIINQYRLDRSKTDSWRIAKCSIKLFSHYCMSAFIDFSDYRNYLYSISKSYSINTNLFTKSLELMETMFKDMDTNRLGFTHDFYLKRFHINLSQGKFNMINYDALLLDEAQDVDNVTYEIFKLLPVKQKVIVGDSYQSIYGFRGMVNILDTFEADSSLWLTKSFRFGEEIENYANFIIRLVYNGKPVKGLGIKKDNNKKVFISRTNTRLVSYIADFIKNGIEDWTLVRNPKDVFSTVLDCVDYLQDKKEIPYLDLVRELSNIDIEDKTYLKLWVEECIDYEIKMAMRIIKDIGIDKIYILYRIAEHKFVNNKEASIYLTTAHTAKGLEWGNVVIADDFPTIPQLVALFKEEPEKYNSIIQELNLLYVALTRAIKTIECNHLFYGVNEDFVLGDFFYSLFDDVIE